MGAYQLERTREIQAPAGEIWDQLLEVKRWPEWKPFIPGTSGAEKIRGLGDRFRMTIRVKKPFAFPVAVTVCEFDPPRRVAWTGGIPGLVISVHRFLLEDRGASTRVISREEFSGALVGLMLRIVTPQDLEKLHDQWLLAIQRRMESPGHSGKKAALGKSLEV